MGSALVGATENFSSTEDLGMWCVWKTNKQTKKVIKILKCQQGPWKTSFKQQQGIDKIGLINKW